jgi:hypothetical protein
VEHKDFLFMTSPEGRRLFKLLSERNADRTEVGRMRQRAYVAFHGRHCGPADPLFRAACRLVASHDRYATAPLEFMELVAFMLTH